MQLKKLATLLGLVLGGVLISGSIAFAISILPEQQGGTGVGFPNIFKQGAVILGGDNVQLATSSDLVMSTSTRTLSTQNLTLGGTLTTSITGGGTQCLHVSNTGVVSGTLSDCGSSGGGVTAVATTYPLRTTGSTGSITLSTDLSTTTQNTWSLFNNFTYGIFATLSSSTNATTTSLEVGQLASTTNLIVSSAGGAAGCATFSVTGKISNTGSACGGSGGTPGGSNTDVQFNDGGSTFGGTADFTWDKTRGWFTIGSTTNGSQITALSTGGPGHEALVLTDAPSHYVLGDGLASYVSVYTGTGGTNGDFIEMFGQASTSLGSIPEIDVFAEAADAYMYVQSNTGNSINLDTDNNSHIQSAGSLKLELNGNALGGAILNTSLLTADGTAQFPAGLSGTTDTFCFQTLANCGSGGGSTFPFTPTTNYAVNTSATSTPLYDTAGIMASSTSYFDQIQVGSTTASTMATSTFFGGISTSQLGGISGVDFVLDTPNTTSTTHPGNMLFQAGSNSTHAGIPGGSISLIPGLGTSGNGTVRVFAAGGNGSNDYAALDSSGLSGPRTITFPDTSGTLCLTSTCAAFGYPFTNPTEFATTTYATTTPQWDKFGIYASTTSQFDNSTTTQATIGTLYVNGDKLTDLTGTGLIDSAGALTVSGLTTTQFASAAVSQWTNDANYITLASLSATTPIIYTSGTGAFKWVGLATTSQPASSNLLTSNGAAGVYGTATSTLTASGPLTGSFTQVGTGGALGCTTAAAGVAGCLNSSDWSTFNSKQATISATWPIVLSGAALSFGWATTSQPSSSNVFVSNGANGFYGVSTSTLSASSPLTGSFTQLGSGGAIGCQTASGSQAGCESAANFNTFFDKVGTSSNATAGNLAYFTTTNGTPALIADVATGTISAGSTAITVTAGRAAIGGALSINCATASGSQNGCLSSGDWTTFNGKGSGTVTGVTGTYPIQSTGGVAPIISSAFGTTTDTGIARNMVLTTNNAGVIVASSTPTVAALNATSTTAFSYFMSSVGVGTSSPEGQFTVQSTRTGDDAPALIVDGSGTSNGNGDLELEANGSGTTGEANVDFARAGTNYWQLGIQNNGTNGNDFELWDGSNSPLLTVKTNGGQFGFGSSTPYGDFAINADYGDNNALIFNIASSSLLATTTVFSVANTGALTSQVTNATSTFSDGFGTPLLSLFTGSTTGAIWTIAATTSTPANILTLWSEDQYGHITASSTGATPGISSCGTGAPAMSLNANDAVGSLVTGTSASSCTVTFAHAYAVTPVVIISDSNTSAVVDISAVSTTGFTVSMASALTTVTIYYIVEQP